MYKTSANDSLRYQRDFNEIHEEQDWPVLSDPCCEIEAYERDHEIEHPDSVADQNFGVQQPQNRRQRDYQHEGGDQDFEGGRQSGRSDKASPRFA